KGDKKAYDLELRPRLMVQSIEELQDAQVEPDVWKIEGLDRREDCAKVVATARRSGRDKVSCIILGRGEDDKKVCEWLTTAAGGGRSDRLARLGGGWARRVGPACAGAGQEDDAKGRGN